MKTELETVGPLAETLARIIERLQFGLDYRPTLPREWQGEEMVGSLKQTIKDAQNRLRSLAARDAVKRAQLAVEEAKNPEELESALERVRFWRGCLEGV